MCIIIIIGYIFELQKCNQTQKTVVMDATTYATILMGIMLVALLILFFQFVRHERQSDAKEKKK